MLFFVDKCNNVPINIGSKTKKHESREEKLLEMIFAISLALDGNSSLCKKIDQKLHGLKLTRKSNLKPIIYNS